jgi:endo-beta-N-acetylglucosaminidase D
MIRIENLNAEQHQMLDRIWSFTSQDEYLDWYAELDEDDRMQALVLMRLMAYEVLERRVGEFRDQARELLAQFRL